MRDLTGSLALMAVLLASGGCTADRSSSSPSGAAAVCTAGQVEVSLSGDNGAAGTTYVDIVATNASEQTCSLEGYPTVTLVDENGDKLGKSASQNPVDDVAPVTLDQGRSARATVDFPNPGNFPEPTPCTDVGAGMNITLPGTSTKLFMPRRHAYCPGFGVSAFSGWE